MSQNEVIIDEQALSDVSDELQVYIKDYREMLERSIRKVMIYSKDWNDEDFNALCSAISSFMAEIESIEKKTTQLVTRISNKIDAIHALHSMTI